MKLTQRQWRSLGDAILVTGMALVAALIIPLAVLVALDAAHVAMTAAAKLVLILALTQGVSFGGMALLFSRLRGLTVPAHLPTGRDISAALGAYFLALGGAVVGALLAYAAGLEPGMNRIAELGMDDPQLLQLLIPLSFLLIGPGEELLFRGVVQGRLAEAFGARAAVLLASAIFAMVHVFAVGGSMASRLITVAILFLPSMVFGAVYQHTRNIIVPALVHGAYNATLFWLAYLATQSGHVDQLPILNN